MWKHTHTQQQQQQQQQRQKTNKQTQKTPRKPPPPTESSVYSQHVLKRGNGGGSGLEGGVVLGHGLVYQERESLRDECLNL